MEFIRDFIFIMHKAVNLSHGISMRQKATEKQISSPKEGVEYAGYVADYLRARFPPQ